MKITYDSEAQAVYIYVHPDRKHDSTHNVDDDINVDVDAGGQTIGIEILGVTEPPNVEDITNKYA